VSINQVNLSEICAFLEDKAAFSLLLLRRQELALCSRPCAIFRRMEVQTVFQYVTSLHKSSDTSTGWMVLDDSKERAINILPLKITRRKYFLLNIGRCLLVPDSTGEHVWNYEMILSKRIRQTPKFILDRRSVSRPEPCTTGLKPKRVGRHIWKWCSFQSGCNVA
jgi:hypothetical protein